MTTTTTTTTAAAVRSVGLRILHNEYLLPLPTGNRFFDTVTNLRIPSFGMQNRGSTSVGKTNVKRAVRQRERENIQTTREIIVDRNTRESSEVFLSPPPLVYAVFDGMRRILHVRFARARASSLPKSRVRSEKKTERTFLQAGTIREKHALPSSRTFTGRVQSQHDRNSFAFSCAYN